MSIEACLNFLGGVARDSHSLSMAIADVLDLIDMTSQRQEPLEENGWTNEIVWDENGGRSYPHHNGVKMNEWPPTLYAPSSCNDTAQAVIEKLSGKPVGVWFHHASLNLVLEGPNGERPGLKSNAIIFRGEGVQLLQLLQDKFASA